MSFLIIIIVCKYALQGIIAPIIVPRYPSINFLLLLNSVQFVIIFFVMYLISLKVTKTKITAPPKKKYILAIGLLVGLMAISMTYSINPLRTPILLQTIFVSMAILPSVIFRKMFVNKIVIYSKRYIFPSIICFVASVTISLIPFVSELNIYNYLWIVMYIFGVICLSGYSTLQEKYITDTNDDTFVNKASLVFYTRVTEFVVLLALYWLEYYIGYDDNVTMNFVASCKFFVSDTVLFVLTEVFVISYVAAYLLATYLNSISSNYNMLITFLTNPVVAIFFYIVPELNIGPKYPLWSLIIAMVLSIGGVLLWIRGEKTIDIYLPIVDRKRNSLLKPLTSIDNMQIQFGV